MRLMSKIFARRRSGQRWKRSGVERYASLRSSPASFAVWPEIWRLATFGGFRGGIAETQTPPLQLISEMRSDRDRQILHRFFITEEDKGKICADLGLTSLHFNRVLSRALKRFKDLYEKKFGKNRE